MRHGSGEFAYEVVENWARIPSGWDLVEIPGIAVDAQDNLWCVSRSDHPIVVFDRDGNFLTTWGADILASRPHGICVGPDGNIWVVEARHHCIRKFTPEGKLLLTLGTPGQHSDTGFVPWIYTSVKHGGPPFAMPTNLAFAPDGTFYVADGYGNARVHHFSPEGELLLSWGQPGTGAGEFHVVHAIAVGKDGTIYVGDRDNNRVQLFSPTREYITEWNDAHQPSDIFIDPAGNIFIAELRYDSTLAMRGTVPAPEDEPSRVTVRNSQGKVLSQVVNPDATAPGGFLCAHGVRTDSRGDLYVCEDSATRSKMMGLDRSKHHFLQKFRRVR